MCFGIEDVDETKMYRGRRDACTYMRSTSGQPYALTAIIAWKERHSPSPVSIGLELRAGRNALAEPEVTRNEAACGRSGS